jgi:hypothetical protein
MEKTAARYKKTAMARTLDYCILRPLFVGEVRGKQYDWSTTLALTAFIRLTQPRSLYQDSFNNIPCLIDINIWSCCTRFRNVLNFNFRLAQWDYNSKQDSARCWIVIMLRSRPCSVSPLSQSLGCLPRTKTCWLVLFD